MKFTVKLACAIIIILISTGCATTQLVPVPTLDRDPNSAIIILKRLSISQGVPIRVEIYDNDKLIGSLAREDELKWSREEGSVRLEVKCLTIWGTPHPEIRANAEFEAKKNNVYVLNFSSRVIGGKFVSTLKLENNEHSKAIFTSSPSGATIFAGPSQDSLKSLNCKTPCTATLPAGKSHWAAEYYKMTLAGYEDSAVVYKNDTYSDREVYFNLKPLQPAQANSSPMPVVEPSTTSASSPEIKTDKPISISITSPEIDRGLKVILKYSTLTVTGVATGGSGVSEILVNGQQAALDDQGHFSAEVWLKPGENQITVSATDTQRKSHTRTFSITREIVKVVQKPEIEIKKPVATVTINTGKYHALIIAVQDYSSKEINKLDHPIADAIAIKNILTRRYTFDDKNIVFLKNPDRKTIGTTFNDLRKKLSENDNLLIFYAGHGVWMDDMREGYWLPRDASGINNPTDWIPNSTIRNYIRALKAKHVLLVADACFAGGIFKVREAFTSPNASIEKIYEMQSRKAITSGSLKTVPDRSVFVEYFVKRLNENIEQYLDAQQLFVSFREAVINNSPNNQTPLYGAISEAGDEGGDFVFVRRQQ